MQIENMSTALRPRTGPEAIDLGFNMAQRWFLPLLLLWCAAAIPLFILLSLLPFIGAFWAVIIIWWLKPLFEQTQLYYLSRALFGEYPSIRQILKRRWRISRIPFISLLIWRRFSLRRSFQAPVAMLEAPEGEAREARLELLSLTSGRSARWLHIFCYSIESLLWLNLCVLLAALLPGDSLYREFYSLLNFEEIRVGWVSALFYLLAMAVIAPFYVSAGFSLYLARRGELEGWDIELNFRRIAGRLKKRHSRRFAGLSAPFSALSLGLGISLLLVTATRGQPAWASDRAQAKILIEEILQQEEFGKTEIVKRWQLMETRDNKEGGGDFTLLRDIMIALAGIMPWFARLVEFLLWAAAIILLLYLVTRFSDLPRWAALPRRKADKKYNPPTRLFGLDISAESPPEDMIAAAQERLADGQAREALGLLYRASLARLIFLHRLEITEAATEGECRRLVEKLRPRDEAGYFTALTRAWLLAAYAHETPDRDELTGLCDRWTDVYGQD